jgi:HK97 family phage prohead protease
MTDASLPQPVLDRLGDTADKLTAKRSTKRGKVEVEVRTLAQAPEIKAANDNSWNLRGYATVYDVAYPIAGGPEAGGWMEIVERGATAKSIKDGADVRLLFDHDGIPLARSTSGSMRLISDDLGMMVDADLDPASPYAQSVRSAVLRGDADQMSFAFRVTRQEWNEDYTERRIKEVAAVRRKRGRFPSLGGNCRANEQHHPRRA